MVGLIVLEVHGELDLSKLGVDSDRLTKRELLLYLKNREFLFT